MPRISTDNYDTVASWNGSQDLFIVEQPDGTKVATPALLKQYVLAGVTETSEQYAESSTARNVTAKTVTLPGFELETGTRISVRFTDTGTSNPASGNLTLNVNGTGAKEIVDSHTNKTKLTYTSGGLFYNNIVNDFIYDGTYWVYMNRDNNTTYTSKAAASGGTATSLCTTGEKYTWNNKQNALTFDDVPTQNSNNPVKSGGVYPLTNTSTVSGTNVVFSRFGKLRILTSNRCTYEDLKTFFNNLPIADKPTSLRFTVMIRTSNDNKYMTTPFVYVGTSGLIAMHFAAYNANSVEGQIGNTDRLIGEIVYTVD